MTAPTTTNTTAGPNYAMLAQRTRLLVLGSYFGLMLVFTLSTLLLPSCNKQPNTVIWVLHILPLLMFVGGVLRQNTRTHVWLAFVSLGYFMLSVTAVLACSSPLMIIETALIVLLFCSSTAFIRWRSRELAPQASEPDTESAAEDENPH